jgi:hypothetical protein
MKDGGHVTGYDAASRRPFQDTLCPVTGHIGGLAAAQFSRPSPFSGVGASDKSGAFNADDHATLLLAARHGTFCA